MAMPFDDAVDRLFHRVSGRTALVIGLVFYPGLGLIVPLSLGLSTFYLALCNLVGVVFAVVTALAWTGVLFDAAARRHLVDWTTELRHLNSTEFERLVGEVFHREGWTVHETGRADGPDGNIDLVLTKPGSRRIVQCKRWQSHSVGVAEIREFLGTLMREGLSADSGIFVTLSTFTSAARAEAEQSGLQIVDGVDLHARIDRVRRSESCPICGSPMKLDRSRFGWWFHCTVNGCRGKRDLGRIPDLVVELMMDPGD